MVQLRLERSQQSTIVEPSTFYGSCQEARRRWLDIGWWHGCIRYLCTAEQRWSRCSTFAFQKTQSVNPYFLVRRHAHCGFIGWRLPCSSQCFVCFCWYVLFLLSIKVARALSSIISSPFLGSQKKVPKVHMLIFVTLFPFSQSIKYW